MARLSNYDKRLKEQDPNEVHALVSKSKCSTVNDFVDWNGLNGEVITRQLTKDEIKLYLDGKLTI